MECICHELQNQLGEEVVINSTTVHKNNGIVLHGITICMGDDMLYPNLYIDTIYERCRDLEEPLDFTAIALDLLEVYEKNVLQVNIREGFFETFHSVKDRIVCKLVNYQKNIDYLEEHPYVPFHDLAIIFYYVFEETPLSQASIFLQKKHFELWNVDVDTVYEEALKNMKRLFPPRIITMEDKILSMMNMQGTQEQASNLYILEHTGTVNGASALLFPGILESFSNQINGDFYLLPSSIHEIILVPAQSQEEIEHYSELVMSANLNCVEAEDFLSNSVYYYEKATKEITYYENRETALP